MRKRKKASRVILAIGTRPNFVKAAPLLRRFARDASLRKAIDLVLVHTGQHYDPALSGKNLSDLGIGSIDYKLKGTSGTHAEQTARILVDFEKVCLRVQPQWVLVVGDVNATLACALAARKTGAKVCHVEAGLRCGDTSMPEEINRRAVDAISQLMLTPSSDAGRNLVDENVSPRDIAFVGNLVIENLLFHRNRRDARPPADRRISSLTGRIALATVHRAENVMNDDRLAAVVDILCLAARRFPVIFPAHPRTMARLETCRLARRLEKAGVLTCAPLSFLEMLWAYERAAVALTDSGGVQEETTALGIPCLTLRPVTERPVTVALGTSTLVDVSPSRAEKELRNIETGKYRRGRRVPRWDAEVSKRCWRELIRRLAR